MELILSSSAFSTVLHDPVTGSAAGTFKAAGTLDQQAVGSNDGSDATFRRLSTFVQTQNGVGGLILCVLPGGKSAINVWSFQKESPIQRLLTPVKLSTICASPDGMYMAGGTHDGRLMVWEIGTGELIASFDAHYRAVNCLKWSNDGAAIVSAGADSGCHVWLLATIVNNARDPLSSPTPYVSLSDHTLPVTDIAVGVGKFPQIRVLTSSLDGHAKVWDLLCPSQPLLSTFVSPNSLPISHVVLDPLERFFIASCVSTKDSQSTLIKVNLYMPDGDRAIGGQGRMDAERLEENIGNGKSWQCQEVITSIHLSAYSSQLFVGTNKATIHQIALPSLQHSRTITQSQNVAPVLFLTSILRPPDLMGKTVANANSEPLPIRPVAQLGRSVSMPGALDKAINIRLTSNQNVSSLFYQPSLPSFPQEHTSTAQAKVTNGEESLLGLETLHAENAKLKDQLAKAMAYNDEMFKMLEAKK